MTELEVLVKERKANEKKSQRLWEAYQDWPHWRTSSELGMLSNRWNKLSQKIKTLKEKKMLDKI